MITQFYRAGDWEDRLATYLDRMSEEPFKYGTNDCALFVAGAIKAMTGVDPAEDYRGKYDTQRAAAEALKEYGEGTLLKTVRAWAEEKSVHFAQRGDLVMKNATTVGVCVGLFSCFVGDEQGESRMLYFPTAQCRYAFAIPFAPTAGA